MRSWATSLAASHSYNNLVGCTETILSSTARDTNTWPSEVCECQQPEMLRHSSCCVQPLSAIVPAALAGESRWPRARTSRGHCCSPRSSRELSSTADVHYLQAERGQRGRGSDPQTPLDQGRPPLATPPNPSLLLKKEIKGNVPPPTRPPLASHHPRSLAPRLAPHSQRLRFNVHAPFKHSV